MQNILYLCSAKWTYLIYIIMSDTKYESKIVSSTASAVVGQTFKGMNKKQLSEWADEQRRKARGY